MDLDALIAKLATRTPLRTEADVQSHIQTLLLHGGLNLEDPQVRLESPAPDRRRIDVEVGSAVIEVKKDLRAGNTRQEGVKQLAGYVLDRTAALGRRYAGILTDGATWELYSLDENGALGLVSVLTVDPSRPDARRLSVWLETVLATVAKISPTPLEVKSRLGSDSAGFRLDLAELQAIYEDCKTSSEVRMKRDLWARLLTAALGSNFRDDDRLFIEHTYLVLVAELIAHGTVGFDLVALSDQPSAVVTGDLFRNAGISGVVEKDFFDWPIETVRGARFVSSLARRMARFEWRQVEHDVLKILYESVISAATRKSLGEYYTPDWLAERIVLETVDRPGDQRVLDPACGSGTFLFWAVRFCAEALEGQGLTGDKVIAGVTERVFGIDLHPVAVTLARVTYLLALGADRLANRSEFGVPVYLGDSIQFAQNTSVVSAGGIEVLTTDGQALFSSSIFFPEDVVADAGRFDRLVVELADRAHSVKPNAKSPSIAAILNRYGVLDKDRSAVEDAFNVLCDLHRNGRDHIWGYYVRNLARPLEFSRPQHQVDRLIGNPPWLAARFMTEPMRDQFRRLSRERGLLTGHHAQRDLSGLFVARSIELYLRVGGRFGFVMPRAALSRNQFSGFRDGDFSSLRSEVKVAFNEPWDLQGITPSPFPVPAAVVLGERSATKSSPLPASTTTFAGKLPDHFRDWTSANQYVVIGEGTIASAALEWASPYGDRFRTGAPLYPRMLVLVDDDELSGPLGAPKGKRAVRSRPSLHKPWSSVPPLVGVVEAECLYPVHLGETTLPFRMREPQLAVLPWIDDRLADGGSPVIDRYPGTAQWWRAAEALWEEHQPATNRLSLIEKLNYVRSLESQFPRAEHRVVYTKAGVRLAAARLDERQSIIENKLYWAATASVEEGRYLCAVLNSLILGQRVAPFQAQGQYGPRDFDKYVWKVGVPCFDPAESLHLELALAGEVAEAVAAAVPIDPELRFQPARKLVRAALDRDGIAAEIESLVERLLV